MAVRGISSYSYTANVSSSSDQLAALLKRSSVNTQMLRKAYTALEKTSKKTYLNSTDLSNDNVLSEYFGTSSSVNTAENENALKNNTAAMYSSSVKLFSGASMSDEDFVTSVKQFAEDYNNTVNTLKDSDNYVAVSSGINMVNTTKSYSAALKGAGITVNDDNTLSVDETALKANISSAKSMFKGNYSYGGKMAKKASDLQTIARLTSSSGAGIYNRYGIFYGSGSK